MGIFRRLWEPLVLDQAPGLTIKSVSRDGKIYGRHSGRLTCVLGGTLDSGSGDLRICLGSDKLLTIFEPQAAHLSNADCVCQGSVEVSNRMHARGVVDHRTFRQSLVPENAHDHRMLLSSVSGSMYPFGVDTYNPCLVTTESKTAGFQAACPNLLLKEEPVLQSSQR